MVGEWAEVHLQDIAVHNDRAFAMGPFGSNIKAENYREFGVPVIRGTNLGCCGEEPFIARDFVFLTDEKADELMSSNAKPNDIIFVAQGTVGKVGIIPSDTPYQRFVLSQNLMKVTIDTECADPRYIFYYYRSSLGQHEIMSRVNPTGVPCISKPLTSLRQFKVRMPVDVNEQQAIACILGALDDKIELNRRMNETLEDMARAIFKSWFVDFDPVRAKAAGQKPIGLAPHIADLFPDAFEDSELGEIPKGWSVRFLPDLIEVNPPRSLPKGVLAPYLDMSNMPTDGPAPAAWVMRKAGSGMKFVNGDTLVARITPCLENGKTSFVGFLANGQVGWGSTEYIVLRPKAGIPSVFAYLLACTRDFRAFAIQQMTGSSGRQRVPADSLSKYQIASPDAESELFLNFGKLVTPIFERIPSVMAQSRTLAELRDALLPKLISGDLRVNDAERIIRGQIQ